MRGARPSQGRRLPGIEGLRALAACSILVYHVWAYSSPHGARVSPATLGRVLPDLQFGVILFFALSGFLLYRPFAAAVVRGRALPSWRRYLHNRALRILPAYWVILLLVMVVFGSALVRHGADVATDGGFSAGLFARSALFLQDYTPGTLTDGIGPAWSLAVEVVFYLVLPLLAAGAWMLARRAATRGGRRLSALAPAAALLVFGLSGKAAAAFAVPPAYPYGGFNTDWHSVLERSFWCQADLFAFGMALAVLRVDWEDGRLRLPRHWRAYAWVGVLAMYLMTTATHRDEQLSYSPYNTVMALACALLLALVVLNREGERAPRFVRLLETRPLIAVGLASYSLFLWHEPITHFLNRHGMTLPGVPGLLFNLVLVGAAAGALSALTYRLVEAVALRRKASTRVRSEPALAVPDTAPELLAEPAV